MPIKGIKNISVLFHLKKNKLTEDNRRWRQIKLQRKILELKNERIWRHVTTRICWNLQVKKKWAFWAKGVIGTSTREELEAQVGFIHGKGITDIMLSTAKYLVSKISIHTSSVWSPRQESTSLAGTPQSSTRKHNQSITFDLPAKSSIISKKRR